jgi:transcriptional regulator with XRE-family HTH domain
MIDPPDRIGLRLAALRDLTGLKQEPFAEGLGITQPAWNQYEKGRRRITLDVAASVAEKYGVTLDWIYKGEVSGLPIRLEALSKIPFNHR